VRIGLRNNTPEAMELTDTFGQTSALTFTKFEKNPTIAADQFKFVTPKGADVLQQ
jgi:outer membrane lipoprotein carrier protein